MSDRELKDLVASLAIAQQKTDEQLQRTDEQISELRLSQQRTDEQIAQLRLSQQQTDEQLQRTDKKLERVGEKLDKVARLLGGIGQNQGDIAEEFFYNALIEKTEVAGIKYDDILRGMEKHRGKLHEEYDIVLTNGNAIALIEVKYKANLGDIAKIQRKEENFKKLFPIYKDYKIHSGLATFYLNSEVKEELLNRGYFALERKGDIIETIPLKG